MARGDPFVELRRFQRELNKLFRDLWSGRWLRTLPAGGEIIERREGVAGTPLVDVIDEEDKFIVRADMPGVKKENLKVDVTENRVTISGKIERERERKSENYFISEREYSSWKRIISLPAKIKPDKAKAKYEQGVLEITLPKIEKEEKGRRLEIE